jgi:hypothetical protein
LDDLVVAVEHILDADLARLDARSIAFLICRQASCALRMNGVSSISAPELASVSSIVFESISRWPRRF